MANSRTQARIEARILERVAHCFQFELNDPRASFLTVTSVSITSDLQLATVSYSVLGGDADKSKVRHMLEDATGFVRRRVGRVLKTRRIPALRWRYDDSVERQEEIEGAIQSALARDRAINPEAHVESPPAPSPLETTNDEAGDEGSS